MSEAWMGSGYYSDMILLQFFYEIISKFNLNLVFLKTNWIENLFWAGNPGLSSLISILLKAMIEVLVTPLLFLYLWKNILLILGIISNEKLKFRHQSIFWRKNKNSFAFNSMFIAVLVSRDDSLKIWASKR